MKMWQVSLGSGERKLAPGSRPEAGCAAPDIGELTDSRARGPQRISAFVPPPPVPQTSRCSEAAAHRRVPSPYIDSCTVKAQSARRRGARFVHTPGTMDMVTSFDFLQRRQGNG